MKYKKDLIYINKLKIIKNKNRKKNTKKTAKLNVKKQNNFKIYVLYS